VTTTAKTERDLIAAGLAQVDDALDDLDEERAATGARRVPGAFQ
jgi:hypothetical protein